MEFLSISVEIWAMIMAVTVLAGVVKGTVGFAMPMIIISGVSSFAAPELALAALILPTVMTNAMLLFRGGTGDTVRSLRPLTGFVAAMLVSLTISAQLVPYLAPRVLLLAIGIPVTALTLVQLAGWRPHVRKAIRRPVAFAVGAFAGTIGGIGGVWGPPTVLYLTAIDTPKAQQLRAQGAIYGAGSVVLLASHVRSGVINGQTIWLSAAMLVPAFAGMLIGFRLHDRLDQERFRTVTLVVLVVAGLNLIRRGLSG